MEEAEFISGYKGAREMRSGYFESAGFCDHFDYNVFPPKVPETPDYLAYRNVIKPNLVAYSL